MRAMVDDNHRLVARMLRKGGVPRNDLDDEIQRTFIVAARRLEDVTPGAERSFLFQVARNRASHARRSMARCRESLTDELPERSESRGTPEDLTGRKQIRVLLDAALAGLDESLRSVFILFEVEGLDMQEIATKLKLPRGTVASRLRRGRAQIRRSLPVLELAWSLGLDEAEELEGPALMRREQGSRLERALLRIGTATPTTTSASAALRERTLASCRVLVAR
jgi:RNA polymerase sigma-70 factor (ECF subfamily)